MKGKQKKMNLKRVLIIGLTLCGIMPGVGAQEFNEGITGSKSTDEIYVTTGVLKDGKYLHRRHEDPCKQPLQERGIL